MLQKHPVHLRKTGYIKPRLSYWLQAPQDGKESNKWYAKICRKDYNFCNHTSQTTWIACLSLTDAYSIWLTVLKLYDSAHSEPSASHPLHHIIFKGLQKPSLPFLTPPPEQKLSLWRGKLHNIGSDEDNRGGGVGWGWGTTSWHQTMSHTYDNRGSVLIRGRDPQSRSSRDGFYRLLWHKSQRIIPSAMLWSLKNAPTNACTLTGAHTYTHISTLHIHTQSHTHTHTH